MCPRVIRLAGQRRLDQHLGLLEVSPPEPRDGRICLRFDVIGLELQRVVEITSCLLVLSLRNGKISELAQTERERLPEVAFRLEEIAGVQKGLRRLELPLQGLSRAIGCSSEWNKRHRQRGDQNQDCRKGLQRAIESGELFTSRTHGGVPKIPKRVFRGHRKRLRGAFHEHR